MIVRANLLISMIRHPETGRFCSREALARWYGEPSAQELAQYAAEAQADEQSNEEFWSGEVS